MWEGSTSGSRRKPGPQDEENELLGAGRMPRCHPCILGPSSACLSLTVITVLPGLQSNRRSVHRYGRCGVEAVEGGRARAHWQLLYGPWSRAPSCLVKPYTLHAGCILVCFSDAPFRSRQVSPGAPEDGIGEGQTSPSVGEMGEGTPPFGTFKGIFETMIPVAVSLGMGAAGSL